MQTAFSVVTPNSEQLTGIKKFLRQNLYNAYKSLIGRDSGLKAQDGGQITSWEGSGKNSPSIDRYNRRFYEPQERRALLAQLVELLADHPVLQAALMKYAWAAVAAGFKPIVKSAMRGDEQRIKAQIVINRCKKLSKLESHLPMMAYELCTFGDVFIQIATDENNELTKIKAMPNASMERLSDDLDEWIDPQKAFLQKDVATDQIVAYFSSGQIVHGRHLLVPGHRYGSSQIFSARGTAKDAIDAIRSLLPRRLANQPFRWFNIQGFDNQPLSQTQFDEFKKNTSRKVYMQLGGTITAYDEVFTNNINVSVLGGDKELGTMGDIEMVLDATMAVIGVSRQLLGWGTNINRDILDEQRAELYASQVQFCKEVTEQILMPIFEMALKLQRVNPDELEIEIEYPQELTETQKQRLIDNARKDFLAGGLDRRSYVSILKPYYKLGDIEEIVRNIDIEKAAAQQQSRFGYLPSNQTTNTTPESNSITKQIQQKNNQPVETENGDDQPPEYLGTSGGMFKTETRPDMSSILPFIKKSLLNNLDDVASY